jgi:hypothetical protein
MALEKGSRTAQADLRDSIQLSSRFFMQKLGDRNVKDSQVLLCPGEKPVVCACQRAEELSINIGL